MSASARRTDGPWNETCAEQIGAAWLRDALAPGGALGRAARERERAFEPGDEAAALAAIERVAHAAATLAAGGAASLRATIAGAPDPGPALVRARTGGVLGDVDFFELSRFADALAEVNTLAAESVFAELVPPDASGLRALLGAGRTAERTFYLADSFDAALAAARDDAALRRTEYDLARSRLAERVARYAGVERVRDGEFVLMRDAIVLPVPPEIRVVRETSTYLLCEISLDEPALEALRALDAANVRAAEAEERVRGVLSLGVAAAAAELEGAAEMLGALDLFLARVAFAQRHACVVPDVVESAEIAFTDARYLPLEATLERHGRRYAPISLELTGIGIVTGPNMGGKTAALRTLGFLAACVAVGVPVPASDARIALFDDIAWLGIGTAASEEGLLSAFGSEVVAVRAFLAGTARRALVLIDEFARTTSPLEGRALLIALLETLRARGAVALAATHLANVVPGGAAHFAIGGLADLPPRGDAPLDLETALARIANSMDYRLRRAGEDAVPISDAIALADALGLEPELIARARANL